MKFCIFFFCRKIRPCPSINPGCVSTNPKSSSFAFPLTIPENYSENAIQVLGTCLCNSVHFSWIFWFWVNWEMFFWHVLQKLQEVILKTQRNAKIQVVEDTPDGNLTGKDEMKTNSIMCLLNVLNGNVYSFLFSLKLDSNQQHALFTSLLVFPHLSPTPNRVWPHGILRSCAK